MNAGLTAVLVLAGTLFGIVAAVGMLRLPDTITRMHASTKAGTLGAGLILAAVALHFKETGITLRAGAAILFLVLTAPVAAHVIGRAAYLGGIRLWDRTWKDELADLRRLPRPTAGDRPVSGDEDRHDPEA